MRGRCVVQNSSVTIYIAYFRIGRINLYSAAVFLYLGSMEASFLIITINSVDIYFQASTTVIFVAKDLEVRRT